LSSSATCFGSAEIFDELAPDVIVFFGGMLAGILSNR
jgi:hypothetical protein